MKIKIILLTLIGFSQVICGQQIFENKEITKVCSKGIYIAQSMNEYYSPIEDNVEMCIPKNIKVPNSSWYSWKIDHPGTIEFLLTPLSLMDDIDFEVYLETEPDDLRMVRCMAAGPNIGANEIENCLGITGMVADKIKIRETLGCDPTKTNFTAPIYTVKEQTYFLRVLNFSSNKGFSLKIDGTAELSGDFKTDFTYEVENNKTFHFESILSNQQPNDYTYQWHFGENANPINSNLVNPPPVQYKTVGVKEVLLETWDKEGCYQQAFQTFSISKDQLIKSKEANISVYPNPFLDEVNISLNTPIPQGAKISIYDTKGMEVFVDQLNNENYKELKVSTLAAGIYLLRIQSSDIDETIELVKLNAQGN